MSFQTSIFTGTKNEEQDRIRYAFHGAGPKKAVGVYQREDLGDLEEIRGFEVEGESRLVSEVSLNGVQPDFDRRIKIRYAIGGKSREQLLESTTIEQSAFSSFPGLMQAANTGLANID